ncbi:PLDc N-terminal domain-containing protein [Pontibacter silvestris]|uniref:PLDc N-terminal domain-containing protein n=1 Tax=Pontibacter silvestris TaxID=2305183 RepID=A0ABW4WWJ4_9BACT|nr:PLDc N-terminal domain-containing protein [Pontibacter silvestris]MCC9136511.1 PLDc N-terminal domain-containing protein [Pontibacter silvestris]
MDLFLRNPFLFVAVLLNYLMVVYSLYHLIFKTNYTLNERLTWMVVLWIIPVLGPFAYWFFWDRRKA